MLRLGSTATGFTNFGRIPGLGSVSGFNVSAVLRGFGDSGNSAAVSRVWSGAVTGASVVSGCGIAAPPCTEAAFTSTCSGIVTRVLTGIIVETVIDRGTTCKGRSGTVGITASLGMSVSSAGAG
jgi:hypothetical protein